MRRWTAALVAAFLVLTTFGGWVQPEVARADPVTAVYLSYNAYLAALATAAGSYGAQSYASCSAAGISGREQSAIAALLQRQGAISAQQAQTTAIYAYIMAVVSGQRAMGVWTRFQAAVAGAYAYGSYAWIELVESWGHFLAFQGANVSAPTYPGRIMVDSWPSNQYTFSASNYTMRGAPFTVDPTLTGNRLKVCQWLAAELVGYGCSAVAFSTTGCNPGEFFCRVGTGQRGFTLSGSGVISLYSWADEAFATSIVNAAPAPAYPDNPVYEPAADPAPGIVIPGPWPGSPGTPAPQVDPSPGSPDLVPVPLPVINDPGSKLGTATPISPAMPTTTTPVPYVPPIGVDKTPIPPGGVALPGKKARDAATALDAAVPDMLGWLKAPFVAILNWLADFQDWLASLWNQVCGWVASWVVPSDAGLAQAWTVPWANLQSSASSRWPFAIGTISSSLYGVLFNTTGGTPSIPLVFTMHLDLHGLPAGDVPIDLNQGFAALDPYKGLGEGMAWLWLVVSLFMSFRPTVVT